MGNKDVTNFLVGLVRKHRPLFLFLIETKSDKRKMAKISRKLGFYNMEIVKAERNSRGLALLWSDEANFTCNWKSSFGRCLPTLSQQETC